MSNYEEIKKTVKNDTKNAYREGKDKANDLYEEGKDKASDIYNTVKDTVSDYYADGKKKVNRVEDSIGDYTDELVSTVKDKPLISLLIAGGVGYLLSCLLKK